MKILTISSMFPSKPMKHHAIFVKNRISQVAKHASIKVIVPVPYFPFGTLLKRYSFRKHIPYKDTIDNMEIFYPRFLSIPRFLKPLDGFFLFLSCLLFIKKNLEEFHFDLIDSHLAYPDGFGSVLLGKVLKKPVTITLRGHDINSFPACPVRFRQIKYALKQADLIFSVAQALKDEAVKFGIDENKIIVSSNGVDTSIFKPLDMGKSRKELSLPTDKKIIISVGNLVERKGFHILLLALKKILNTGRSDILVLIVGGPGEEGDYSKELTRIIDKHNLSDFVIMAGAQDNKKLPEWYSASNLSCLASSKEGWANVLLESLACGRPVVATNVWGTPEVICSSKYGVLTFRNPDALATALCQAIDKSWDVNAIVSYARHHTWENVAEKLIEHFRETLFTYQSEKYNAH